MATAIVSSVLIHRFSPFFPPGTRSGRPTRRAGNLLDAFLYREGFPCKGIRWCRERSRVVAQMVGRPTNKQATVVPDPDYRIPVVLLGLAGGLIYQDNLLTAAPVGLLGLLLLFQTTRVRFVFDNEALEVKVGDKLEESGENVFVGGKNRWKYSTFVNWELWWPDFPILVYFKEKQTKPEGQVHFFPVIFNGRQLYDVMVERAGPSKNSGPKEV
ncbi:uncharacterized protein LOC116267535 [Nymphaea colorata]|nr:uncharacterized protein LOC116267535 [Nymphaea colorata]